MLPLKAAVIRGEAHKHLEDLPGWCNTVIGDALSELTHLNTRIHEYDKHIAHIAKEDEQSRQLMQLGGIGPTTASAIVATVGKGHDFTCGRQFCAWLGLVPGQYSSGGKQRLGRITKAGDPYLRTLLIMGAKAVLSAAKNKTDPVSRWARSVCRNAGVTGRRWWPLRPRTRACAGPCCSVGRRSRCLRNQHRLAASL